MNEQQAPRRGTISITLTRDRLESAMIRWAYTREGPIAGEFISALIGEGNLLSALPRVAESVNVVPSEIDDDVMLIVSAWHNYQQFGSPGFPVSTASSYRDMMQVIDEVEIEEDE